MSLRPQLATSSAGAARDEPATASMASKPQADRDYVFKEYNENAGAVEQAKARMHEAEIKIAELMHENSTLLADIVRLDEEKNRENK